MLNMRLATWVLMSLILCMTGCTKKPEGPTLWIYTSIYNHVIQDFNAKLATRFPGVTIKWYQSGSENVAAKINTELLAGKPQADLLLTSDPFYYEDLKSQKILMKYDSPAAATIPPQFRDPDRFWAIVRVPAAVIAYNSEAMGAAAAPQSFADLTQPRFKNQIAMANPLESGTAFTTVAVLSKRLGWDFFKKLRENGAISAGGNSSVLARIETKERPVGIIALENILAARRKNPKLVPVFPIEGVVLIPSPIAILAASKQPELAKKLYDYFFSQEGQETLVHGDQHGVIRTAPPPIGTPPLLNFMAQSFPWDPSFVRQIRDERADIKQKFSKIMLE